MRGAINSKEVERPTRCALIAVVGISQVLTQRNVGRHG
jgi:hypothetical protein